jgi:hypothetical protein
MSNQLSFAKDIRPMFTGVDVDHMKAAEMDLSAYDDVKNHAVAIYSVVSEGTMPPPGTGETWSAQMCATFKQWQEQGCPP